jgi:hypothetical protein
VEVESQITAVTLYARGARVRRAATLALAGAASRVRIAGLPAAVMLPPLGRRAVTLEVRIKSQRGVAGV